MDSGATSHLASRRSDFDFITTRTVTVRGIGGV